MLTYEEQELNRQERLSEVGTEPPCPFCQNPRVSRSDYIRCNPCGRNWLNEEMGLEGYLDGNPAACRAAAARMARGIKPTADTSEAGASE